MEFKDIFSTNISSIKTNDLGVTEESFLSIINYFQNAFPDYSNKFDSYKDKLTFNGLSEELIESFKSFLVYEVFTRYTHLSTLEGVSETVHKLYWESTLYYALNRDIVFDESSSLYKVYPLDKDKDVYRSNKVLLNLLNQYFKRPSISFEALVSEITAKYEEKNNEYKKKVKSTGLKPYYGNEEYLLGRINYIIKCLETIINDPSIDPKVKIPFEEAMELAFSTYNEYVDFAKTEGDEHVKYDALESCYKKFTILEEKLVPLIAPLWEDYLTDPKDYEVGKPFHFLVHSTNKCENSISGFNKVCCTLATDKCMPIPYGDVGYIVKFNPENLDSMSNDDSGSWIISTEEFIERNFPPTWQLTTPEKTQSVYYESPTISKLIIPSEMEKEMIAANEKFYGNALNTCGGYTEVFLRSGSTPLENIGFFAKTLKGLEEIEKLPSALPKTYLDLEAYRRVAGLPPEEEKRAWY